MMYLKKTLLLQASVSGAYINHRSEESQKHSKINDNMFLPNFKGISNIGCYQFAAKGSNGAQNVGIDKYLQMQVKLFHIRTPLLKQYQINPFLHSNVALAPNNSQEQGLDDGNSGRV